MSASGGLGGLYSDEYKATRIVQLIGKTKWLGSRTTLSSESDAYVKSRQAASVGVSNSSSSACTMCGFPNNRGEAPICEFHALPDNRPAVGSTEEV